MRILADENVHSLVVQRLREAGYQVEAIAETAAGSADEDILNREDIADHVLVTYDRDFGELIFNRGMPAPKTLIYSRLGRAEPRHVADRIVEIVAGSLEAGNCYVISKDGVRVRSFTAGSMFDA